MSTATTDPLPGAAGFRVSTLSQPDEFAECESLYREVFTADPGDTTINPRLLLAIGLHGGIVVGARAQGRLIGFVYSFLARDRSGLPLYQYSQTAGVTQPWRGLGVGRALKLAQRDAALSQGINVIRWLYDPMLAANAHFNLDVLGGVAVELEREAYGSHGPPADGGVPTDRLRVDWQLSSERVTTRIGRGPDARAPVGPALRPGELHREPEYAQLGVPVDWRPLRSEPQGIRLREQTVHHMGQLFADGFVATSCLRLDAQTAVYRFERPTDDEGGTR